MGNEILTELVILNLTQHVALPEQRAWGVVEPDEATKEKIRRLLTFEELPDKEEIDRRARELATLTVAFHEAVETPYFMRAAMLGGAPWLIGLLETYLRKYGIRICYTFSKRVVEEVQRVGKDGKVENVKRTVFRPEGLIWMD